MTPDDVPLGPEDKQHPDRARQQRDPDGTAGIDRHGKPADEGLTDIDAWETEATFDEDAVGSPTRTVGHEDEDTASIRSSTAASSNRMVPPEPSRRTWTDSLGDVFAEPAAPRPKARNTTAALAEWSWQWLSALTS